MQPRASCKVGYSFDEAPLQLTIFPGREFQRKYDYRKCRGKKKVESIGFMMSTVRGDLESTSSGVSGGFPMEPRFYRAVTSAEKWGHTSHVRSDFTGESYD
jgi:hypothetical protein